MSVLIKGMDMPKSCDECDVICKNFQNGWDIPPEYKYKRHPDCPLVEIPKHGDLVDRHVVIGKIEELRSITACFGDDYSRGKTMAYSCAEVEVENAPTAIEAEE